MKLWVSWFHEFSNALALSVILLDKSLDSARSLLKSYNSQGSPFAATSLKLPCLIARLPACIHQIDSLGMVRSSEKDETKLLPGAFGIGTPFHDFGFSTPAIKKHTITTLVRSVHTLTRQIIITSKKQGLGGKSVTKKSRFLVLNSPLDISNLSSMIPNWNRRSINSKRQVTITKDIWIPIISQ